MQSLTIICLFLITSVAVNKLSATEFVKANNLFATTAYREILKTTKGNFLVSPFSAETVLAFALSGCKGETATEIRNALHLPADNVFEEDIKTFHSQLTSNEHYSFYTANKMYVQENYPLKEDFKKKAGEVYHAEAESIDFNKTSEAAEKINTWVEKHTNNKIHNLVDPNTLSNRSRVILLNGLYFKADWSVPFLLSDTEKRSFYRTSSDIIQVDTMSHSAYYRDLFKYYECSKLNAKFLELPFKGSNATMTIILPNEKEGLSTLENQIDRVFTPHNLTWTFVDIVLPKFKIETKIDLKQILENLGVRSAFDKDFADLSGISGEKGDLIIDNAVQKTFIDVSEEGVEAASATFVLIGIPTSGFGEPPKQFIADHPFVFYIKINDVIIFAGRVTDPK